MFEHSVGNLYKNSELEGRKYGKAGDIVDSEGIIYKAHKGDAVGKLSKKDNVEWKKFLKKCK